MKFRFTKHAKSRLWLHFKWITERDVCFDITDKIYKLQLDTVRDMYYLSTSLAVYIISKDMCIITMYRKDWRRMNPIREKMSRKKIDEILYYYQKDDTMECEWHQDCGLWA